MAKVQYGPVVTSASGKVAGVVFSIWKGIPYLKRWVKPTYTNTTAQEAIRTAFASLVQQYKYLTSELVNAWASYVSGKPYTKRNAFIGENVIYERDAGIVHLTPHNPQLFPFVAVTNSSPTTGWVMVNFYWPPNATTGDMAQLYTRLHTTKTAWYKTSAVFPATNATDPYRAGAGTIHYNLIFQATVTKEMSAPVVGLQLPS